MSETLLTHSELRTYKRCRRKWWLQFYRRLVRRTEDHTSVADVGNRVHSALAAYYNRSEDPLAVVERERLRDLSVAPEAADDVERHAELARLMVEGYQEWLELEGADSGLEVYAAEEAVSAPLHDSLPGVLLAGKLDARARRLHDGARLFMDHKSVQEFKTPLKTLHLDEQMLHYGLLEFLKFLEEGRDPADGRADGGLYNMLRRVKRTARANPPFFMRHEVRHNVDELRSYWLRVVEVARQMAETRRRLDAGEDPRAVAYPTPTRDCAWDCEFLGACQFFDDGGDVESVLRLSFERGDPLKRYEQRLHDE